MQRLKNLVPPLIVALMGLSGLVPAGTAAAAPVHRAVATGLHSGPHREIFGFALSSSLADPTVGYPSWDFSLLSTVAFFGLHVQTDGNFAHDSDWTSWYSSDLTNLVNTAHAAGTKVVLTIVLQDFSPGTPNMCAGLAHMGSTVADTVAEVKTKGVDGVNVDYEGLNGSCGTADSSWTRHQLTAFVANLRTALGGAYLSVDTYASSASDSLGFFDIQSLGPYADSFFVMAYDLEYSNYGRPPTSCSSFCLGPTGPLAGYYYNDTTTANQYMAVTPASKVILGVPYYGRKACVGAATPNAYPTSAVVADTYLDAVGEATAAGVQAGSYVTGRDANDPAGQERMDTWFNTTMNCTRELYFDDAIALSHKYDLVAADNLRGVGIWNLNYGGGAPELWNALNVKFGTPTPWYSLGGYLTASPAAASSGASATDVFVRGTDNALWHRSWNGTVWSTWSSLGGNLIADPAAVSQSASRTDVFVIGTDHGIWHRSWNGTAWSAWDSLGGYAMSAPAVSSWGAGRMDLVVKGTDNGLWHRFYGTGWSGWDKVGGYANSNPTIVSWGAGRVDVFIRGTDNALWQRAGDGAGTWSAWVSLGGTLNSAAAAASCASGHLDVFTVGTDGGLWQRGFNGTAWLPWNPLRGSWTSSPAAVCPAATTAVDVFERGPDGALWESPVPSS